MLNRHTINKIIHDNNISAFYLPLSKNETNENSINLSIKELKEYGWKFLDRVQVGMGNEFGTVVGVGDKDGKKHVWFLSDNKQQIKIYSGLIKLKSETDKNPKCIVRYFNSKDEVFSPEFKEAVGKECIIISDNKSAEYDLPKEVSEYLAQHLRHFLELRERYKKVKPALELLIAADETTQHVILGAELLDKAENADELRYMLALINHHKIKLTDDSIGEIQKRAQEKIDQEKNVLERKAELPDDVIEKASREKKIILGLIFNFVVVAYAHTKNVKSLIHLVIDAGYTIPKNTRKKPLTNVEQLLTEKAVSCINGIKNDCDKDIKSILEELNKYDLKFNDLRKITPTLGWYNTKLEFYPKNTNPPTMGSYNVISNILTETVKSIPFLYENGIFHTVSKVDCYTLSEHMRFVHQSKESSLTKGTAFLYLMLYVSTAINFFNPTTIQEINKIAEANKQCIEEAIDAHLSNLAKNAQLKFLNNLPDKADIEVAIDAHLSNLAKNAQLEFLNDLLNKANPIFLNILQTKKFTPKHFDSSAPSVADKYFAQRDQLVKELEVDKKKKVGLN